MELNANQIYAQSDIGIVVNIIKTIIMALLTYYINFKITNKKMKLNFKAILKIILIVLVATVCGIIKHYRKYSITDVVLILIISAIFSLESISKSVLATTISLSVNYIVFAVAVAISFVINQILKINNDYINLFIITIINIPLVTNVFKIRKFKYGFSFLQKNNENTNIIDIFVLNVSSIILLVSIILSNSSAKLAENIIIGLVMFAIIIFITIQKSLQLYYKQKLLQKDLDETKEELTKKVKEIEELEKENLEISKKSHTLVHKQNSLQHKLEQLANQEEISTEEAAEVRERLKEIEKDLYKEKTTIKLDKTEIAQIDNMLEYMQSECKKNKIDFELQINGNIHYMTNNLITKEDLETLLADHIKNAIIAINHTDNVNRSILVRLGEIDGIYSLYIYDSGVEFEKETLNNLGKKPSTTHADEGGTGMGFMNTFDTLRKCEASLIINEFNSPSKENYTKAIIIKFDKKNEFKIESYRYCG